MLWKRFAELLVERLDREAPRARDAMLTSLTNRLASTTGGEADSARLAQNLQRELARRLGDEHARALFEGASLALEEEEERVLEGELCKRVPLGLPGFERLAPGLPACSTILLLGPPGSGKSTLCKQYVAEGLREGQVCIVVSTGEDKPLFERELARLSGLETSELFASGRLSFIDAYSWTHGGRAAGKHDGVYACPTPQLDDVSLALHYAAEGVPRKRLKRLVFDSLSGLFLHNPPEHVLRFAELIRGRLGHDCFTSLFAVEEGMHSQEVLRALGAVTDGTLSLGLEDGGHYLSVPRLRGSAASHQRLRIELSPQGLRVGDVWQALDGDGGKR